MDKCLIHFGYVAVDNFLHDSLHRLHINTLGPTLVQLNADLIDCVFHWSVLWPIRRTTNDMMPTLPHSLIDLRRLV